MYNVSKYIFYTDSRADNAFVEFISNNFGSLRKFANYLGYSVAFVSAFINGKKPNPDKVLEKVFIDYGFDILNGFYPGDFLNE